MTEPAATKSEPAMPDLVTLAAHITAAFVEHQRIAGDEVPALIAAIHGTLADLTAPVTPAAEPAPTTTPGVVGVRKSLADPDFIVSMIDGKRYRALKRHITTHGFTPETYRARYGLPASYPMVAPGYAEARRVAAKKIGLGRKKVALTPIETAPAAPESATPKKRGRPKKAAA